MRTRQIQILTLLTLSLLTVVAWGATNTNTVPVPMEMPNIKTEANTLLLALIPLFVPIIVAGFKALMKFLPTWSLPIIAAALGELLNVVSGLIGGPTTTVLGGVLLGAAGTGLREILDQINQKRKEVTT